MLHFYFLEEVVRKVRPNLARFVFRCFCVLHTQLVDQLAAVQSLLLGELKNLLQLEFFLGLARVVAGSGRAHCQVERQRRIDALGLV